MNTRDAMSFNPAIEGNQPVSSAPCNPAAMIGSRSTVPIDLIVLLDPANIVVNLRHAYGRPEFRNRHYASFHTGPSATSDFEGVLIHGAQGVRSLSVLPLSRPSGDPTH